VRGQPGAVVADGHRRLSAGRDEGVEFARHPPAGDRGVDNQRQTLAGDIVDHDQDLDAPPVREHVRDKVEAPTLVVTLR